MVPQPIETATRERHGYIYNPSRPRSQQALEERVIRQGWIYASRTILAPYGELQWHSHHARNTHLLVEGEIKFIKEVQGVYSYFTPDTYNVEEGEVWITVEADHLYRAVAGPNGCVFIEGYYVLSPTTADRFTQEDRRTFIKVYESDPRYPVCYRPETFDDDSAGNMAEVATETGNDAAADDQGQTERETVRRR